MYKVSHKKVGFTATITSSKSHFFSGHLVLLNIYILPKHLWHYYRTTQQVLPLKLSQILFYTFIFFQNRYDTTTEQHNILFLLLSCTFFLLFFEHPFCPLQLIFAYFLSKYYQTFSKKETPDSWVLFLEVLFPTIWSFKNL